MVEKHKRGIVALGIVLLLSTTSLIPLAGSSREANTPSDSTVITLSVAIPEIHYGLILTKQGEFATIELPDEGHTTLLGEAQLPLLTKLVEIPQGATPELVVLSQVTKTTTLTDLGVPSRIIPVQAPIPKIPGAEENSVFIINNDYYAQDCITPSSPVKITEIAEIRGHRFAVVTIAPVQYIPATGELTIMSSCELQLNLPGSNLAQTREKIERYNTPGFEQMLSKTFVNYGVYENGLTDYARTQGYLIIVYDSFYEEIQPLVTWKQSMGYTVTVTKTSQIPGGATTTNIKTYITNAYNTWSPPPSFVLLVGDTGQIPTWTGQSSGTATDLTYVTITVPDYFPDIYIGRFPAALESHVTAMVDKSLSYEQAIYANYDYLHKAVFMASEDNYQISEGTHNYVISTYLEPNGYTCDKLYSHTYHATSQQVRNALNNGRHLAIYSGHGGTDYWADGPVFYQSDVNALTNYHMYPFVCSHACVTGQFTQPECFGETWLRAPNKAGFAFWGSSANTYWDEDDILEKRMFSAWWDEGLDFIGGMTDRAKILLYQYYGGGGMSQYYFECYNMFGDPSVAIKPPYIYDHNIAVQGLTVPSHVSPGQQVNVQATIINNGLSDETNIQVSFRVNSVEQASTVIPFLATQSFQQVSFPWTVPAVGMYVVTINATLPGVIEDVYYDNEMSTIVVAGPDVAVISLTAPDYAAVGRTTVIAGVVANLGTTNEWITVSLNIDGVVEQTQQVYLTSGSNTNVDFDWIPSETGTYPVGFTASITGEEPYLGNNELSKDVSVFIANGYILLVDDDVGDSYETYYETALMATGYLYERWDRSSQGSPSAATMTMYDAVIWFCGDDYSETLDTTDQTNLQTYLTSGGRLFLTSQEIGYDIGSTAFYQNYLHATYQVDDTNIFTLLGTADDPIGNGLTLGISGGDGANNQNYPDGIQPISPATTVFTYQSSAYKAAVKTDTAGYKVAYFAFGFEAINSPANRNEVMYRVLTWLTPPRMTLEGDCYYPNLDPVTGLTVNVVNLNTKKTWQATIQGNHYTVALTPGRDVNATETLRIIARDNTDCVNVTDHVVTTGEVTAGTIHCDLILNIHYRDLKSFPFYLATMDTGAAIAQMMLNYLWWNSTLNPEGPPLHYPDQQVLFTAFNTHGGLYLDTDEMCSGLNAYRPSPHDEYGYFFSPYANTSVTPVLQQICIWLDYPVSWAYDNGWTQYVWPKPGHPNHVPIAIPTAGNYNNWMTIRGIHTNANAWNYPEFPAVTVYGFWLNDPKVGGLGANTYVTSQQFLIAYFTPITVVGDTYKNNYVALTDPPENIPVNTKDEHIAIGEITPAFTPRETKLVQTGLQTNGVSHDLADLLLIKAARHQVENILKYDRSDLNALFAETHVQGKPLVNGGICTITFCYNKVTFIVQLMIKTGALCQFSVEGI